MSKIRVHEIAKELKVPSKVLVSYLQQINVDVNSHMSAIDPDVFERIRPDIEKNIVTWKNQGLFAAKDFYNRYPSGTRKKANDFPPQKKSKRCNPYITGNPVGKGEAFVGRTHVLKNVFNTLHNPNENGMVLYGQRRIGKTSVLQRLAHTLSEQTDFIPVYFDLQDKAALTLDHVLKHLADDILQQPGIAPFDLWTTDIQSDFKNAFIPHVLEHLPQKTCLVILFDEFDILDSPTHDQAVSVFFPYFSNLMRLDAHRLKFIFVIGRRPEDLSSVYLSLFKGVKSFHVSLLSHQETESLIRLSEQNESLMWSSQTIETIVRLTGGHPYLTQQLCQVIWDEKHEKMRASRNPVDSHEIEPSVAKALACATHSLEWLWDGLGPAERVVLSALAASGPEIISSEDLENRLQESGVRILTGELRDAPGVLEEWNLIQSENGGLRMRVEMLRLWIVEKKPIARVKDELDRILPIAENLFQAAYRLYQSGELNETRQLLQRSLGHNPNHMKANQLLAELLLAEGKLAEARKLLEILYEFNPSLARPRLIQTLLNQAKQASEEAELLLLYEKVLSLDARQPEALTACSQLWKKKGDRAVEQNNFAYALEAYEKAGASEKIEKVKQTIHLNELYLEAIDSLDKPDALKLFIKVISMEPTFRETSRYFHKAVTGVDVQALENRLKKQQIITAELRKELLALKKMVSVLHSEKQELENSTVVKERKELQERIQSLEQEKLELRSLQHKLKTMIEQSVESRKEKARQSRQF
ncbi:MAG: translation initiation factor IF-2 N-terminal domain-containing protein [Candidatus Magnetomorum sp.]|nr:translation initiation factor IF-2 N-terminal domain-containing protein [Candidatus Magnetomorum sp.]